MRWFPKTSKLNSTNLVDSCSDSEWPQRHWRDVSTIEDFVSARWLRGKGPNSSRRVVAPTAVLSPNRRGGCEEEDKRRPPGRSGMDCGARWYLQAIFGLSL